jgi:hypothetical protein
MERLDQGHLHPKLEVPRLTCLGWESNTGLRSGRRALKQKLFGTSTFYTRAHDMAPSSACGNMNIHEHI